jgi:hypothetical protein
MVSKVKLVLMKTFILFNNLKGINDEKTVIDLVSYTRSLMVMIFLVFPSLIIIKNSIFFPFKVKWLANTRQSYLTSFINNNLIYINLKKSSKFLRNITLK